jgi:hypothetical protein
MVVALRDVRVRGEIHTIIDYAADMLQVGCTQQVGDVQCPAAGRSTATSSHQQAGTCSRLMHWPSVCFFTHPFNASLAVYAAVL